MGVGGGAAGTIHVCVDAARRKQKNAMVRPIPAASGGGTLKATVDGN